MMKRIIFFLIFVLSISFVLADTTVNVQVQGNQVAVSGTCSAADLAVGLRAGLVRDIVWIEEVLSNPQNQFSASFNAPRDGTYWLDAACAGDQAKSIEFCVGANCNANPANPVNPANPGNNNPSSSGSGGGLNPRADTCVYLTKCVPDIESETGWSKTKECSKPRSTVKTLQKEACEPCFEEWRCHDWSQCSSGKQSRVCFDDALCGTFDNKPVEEQVCVAGAAGIGQGNNYGDVVPPGFAAAGTTQPPQSAKGLLAQWWQNYTAYFIGSIVFLLLLIIGIIVLIQHHRHKHVQYNFDELKEWVHKEQAMGTSLEDIRAILKQNTGWKDKEIDKAFRELTKPEVTALQPGSTAVSA